MNKHLDAAVKLLGDGVPLVDSDSAFTAAELATAMSSSLVQAQRKLAAAVKAGRFRRVNVLQKGASGQTRRVPAYQVKER